MADILEKEFDKAPWIIRSNGEIISKKTRKPRKTFPNRFGYLTVNYRSNQEQKTYNFYVHRLVAEAFLGEIPPGYAVNHKDGDKTNNDISNLEIVTYSENIRHADRLGLRECAWGERNANAKLSTDQARSLIIDLMNGMSNDEAAEKYGLHSRYVSLVRHKRRWKKLWEQIERATTIETTPTGGRE